MRIFNGLLIISVILLYSCGENKEHTYLLKDKTKAYFGDFSVGDKWVFKNNQDQGIDTLMLLNKIDTLLYKYTEKESDGDFFETLSYQLISQVSNDTLKVRLRSGPNIDTFILEGLYNNQPLSCLLDVEKKSDCFNYNPQDVLNIMPEYELNSVKYSDVIEIVSNQQSPGFPEKAPRYLFSLHNGLIEFEVYNESTNKRVNYSLVERIKSNLYGHPIQH